MTIRLLIAFDNLKQIIDLASTWQTFQPKINMENIYNAPMVSGALSFEVIVCPENHNTRSFHIIEIHKALFGYFTNLSSALDRLAYEINILYQIEMSKPIIDWGYFFGNAHKETPKLSIPLLFNIVNNHNKQKINWIIECRNRLLHDGILNIEISDTIYLPKYPSDPDNSEITPMKIECVNAYWEVVHTIDDLYAGLLTQVKKWGVPLKIHHRNLDINE